MAESILIPLIVFSSIFGIFYVWISTRNKERMALIEKGADASLFATKKKNFSNLTLKLGMLAIGIGIGILMGSLLDTYTTLQEEVSYFSMIFLFAGLFLVANVYIEKKDKRESE
jgi:Na+/H+-dicarboxylate symporter